MILSAGREAGVLIPTWVMVTWLVPLGTIIGKLGSTLGAVYPWNGLATGTLLLVVLTLALATLLLTELLVTAEVVAGAGLAKGMLTLLTTDVFVTGLIFAATGFAGIGPEVGC